LNTPVTIDFLLDQQFREVVVATGVTPRRPDIVGIDHPKVLSYVDVLLRGMPVGKKVAVMGAGGIGFDVSIFLTDDGKTNESDAERIIDYREEWGIDATYQKRGGLMPPEKETVPREVWLLQRSKGKVGDRLGKTTGWAHRLTLKNRGVRMWSEVQYDKIDDTGLHLTVKGQPQVLDVDHVVVCAGQHSLRALYEPLQAAGVKVHLIGGAKEAGELDAKRAIEEGWALTMKSGVFAKI
jgi:2,4-dienoyl-CoA reductase (NADPH2)